jgi:2-C-methyl-D-erythritol 2,4-cyclodiphosphate synthase
VADFRIGYGFDVHRLMEGRRLVLGGVEIESPVGLDGHSDADVLSHSIVDALLGASWLGDIGENFPPSDPKYKDISSLRLLELVRIKLANAGYRIENVDATVICEKPDLTSLKRTMSDMIAGVLGIDPYQVSIKATTTEGLGYTGEGKGIAASAVALISEIPSDEDEEEEEAGYEDTYDDE